jgi:3-oxo-4-pregnene-20-carboxyl-CoA dehydrogenase alpha subunit
VDFTLDEAHLAVAEVAADVLARGGETDSVWAALAKADLLGLALPEELGGAGLGVLATSLVLTEAGRHASAVPALATLACGVLPVVAFGTPAQRENLLPPVASGERLLTAAPHEPGDPLTTRPRTTATRTADGVTLTGTKTGVPHAGTAHRVLVPATTDDGVGVFLVDPAGAGAELAPAQVSGAAPEYRLTLTGAPGEPLGEAGTANGAATGTAAGLLAFALAGACAVADGLLAGALDLTGRHVASREQFGRPLAAFQAVAQQIADVYVAARTLHLAARSACWRLDTGRDADEDLTVASYWLAEELLPALHTCHHLHGGLGVDVEYPMHRYFAAAVDLTRFTGGPAARGERMGELACTSN